MTGEIHTLMRYPLKGALGHSAPALAITKAVGVVGDRQYALKRKEGVPNDLWSSKGNFYVGANTAEMVAVAPYQEALEARDTLYLTTVQNRIGAARYGELVDTKRRFNMSDTKGAFVSFLNLASVRALETYLGKPVHPARFRMNVWIDGLQPFEELTWVTTYPGTRVLRVGTMSFRLDDMCERCKAVDADPITGTYDLAVRDALVALLQQHGYQGSPHRNVLAVMGVLGEPVALSGALRVGDRISLVE